MLTALIRTALQFRLLAVLVIAGLCLLELARLPGAHYGVFPEFAPPTIKIATEAPGFGPRGVERAITTPIEQGLFGLRGVTAMRSQSQAGISTVQLVFAGDTQAAADKTRVATRLAGIEAGLPHGVVPVIAPLQSATGTAVEIGLTAPHRSLITLTALADTLVRPALRAVPGVANVVIFGARPPDLAVMVRPSALVRSGYGFNQIARAAGRASTLLGGGFIDTGNQRIDLAIQGQARDAAALRASLVGVADGLPVTLGDVAQVQASTPPRFGAALIEGQPGLLLIVSSLRGANTLAVASGVRAALARITPALHREDVVVLPDALDPAGFIHEALADLGRVLLVGAGLILIVLMLALRNWRVALISFVSIPVALLAAMASLQALGMSLNTMALAGLAIALGEVVDDAIVDVENIARRLRESLALENPVAPLLVILRASLEVRSAIIYATFAVAVMFTPVLLLGGVAGRLFAPLGIAYIAAILSSLVVALTLTPALSGLLLARRPTLTAHRAGDILRTAYQTGAARFDRHGRAFGLVLVVIVLVAGASVPLLRPQFLPQFREQDVIAHFLSTPGTSLHTTLQIGARAIARVKRLPQVGVVVLHAGRARLGNGHPGVNKAEIDITLSHAGNQHPVASAHKILAALATVPGLRWWANTFLTERINETLSGFTAPLTISVFGPHLAGISADAGHIAGLARRIQGVITASLAAPPNQPVIRITPHRRAMVAAGLTDHAVVAAIHAAYAGQIVGRVYRGLLVEPIIVTLPSTLRHDPLALAALPIAGRNGRITRLGAIAAITQINAPSVILHDGGRRVQVVTVHTKPGQSGAVLARLRTAIAKLHLEAGDYYVTYGGSAIAGGRAQRSLALHALMALAWVMILLGLALRDARAVALLCLGLPVALAGGIAAAWIGLGGRLDLGAMVGLATLFGLTLRNGLLLLIHAKRLVQHGAIWNEATARRAALDRLPAILLTASVTALALLPLALAAGSPGDEIEGPMAIVILGGLIPATLVNLFALPHAAARWLRFTPTTDAL